MEYRSPYHKLLAELMKSNCLNDVEQKIFDILATKNRPISVPELVRMVFGNHPKDKRHKAAQELEIRDAIEGLQGRAVPILEGYRGKYELATDLQGVVNMIEAEEKRIERANYNLKVMWINYGRQIDLYHKLTGDESL
jgi:hypothetical protein